MNGVLVGAPLHSTVVAALRAAAARASGHVNTRTLLVELMRADSVGRWGRIQLYAGDPDAIARKPISEAIGAGACHWEGVRLTDRCAVAMDAAGRLAFRYEMWPLPVGLLALGLVGDETSAAARALREDGLGRAAILESIQSEVFGTRLDGIGSVLPTVMGEARQVLRERPVSRPAGALSKPWSLRRRMTVGGLLAVVVAAGMALAYIVDARVQKANEKPELVANTAEVRTVWSMRDGCDKPRTYYPEMDAYAGTGPHRVATFTTSDMRTVEAVTLSETTVPFQWNSGSAVPDPDVRRVQLIACLGQASQGVFLKECWFDGGNTLPMYQGIYQATLYEAKTGKKVASARVMGKREERCPVLVMTLGKLYSVPGLSELQQSLGQYVDH